MTVELTADAALVLLVVVARLNESESLAFEDQAEQRVLWDLEAALEAAIPSVTAGDFSGQVVRARARVRDVE